MTLLAPNVGDALLLQYMLNKLTPGTVEVHLYNNNQTPSKTDTISNYTETTASGYTAFALPGTNWTVSTVANVTTASYSQLTFSFTSSDTIYGYYITTANKGQVLISESFSSAGGPYSIPGSGNINLTLKLSLS